MMHLSFRELRKAKQPVSSTENVSLPRIVQENAQVLDIGSVRCELVAEAVEHLCRAQGKVTAEVTYECSRCMEPFQSHLRTDVDERFTDDVSKQDEDLHVVAGDEVDFDPYVEQAVNLALEFCPVCSDTCRGLCPVCGINLNEQTCNCETKPVDPRFAALEGLLSSDKSK